MADETAHMGLALVGQMRLNHRVALCEVDDGLGVKIQPTFADLIALIVLRCLHKP